MDLDQIREQRKQLAHRRRRVIYNNDGDEAYRMAGQTREQFLAARTTGVENTHVDTISYCVVEGPTHGKYRTRLCDFADFAATLGGNIEPPGLWTDARFQIDGQDALGIIGNFCREHDIEWWTSIRMNDTHDQWWGRARTAFKGKHPERWLAPAPDLDGGVEEKMFLVSEGAYEHPDRWIPAGSCGCYFGADYARPEVRDAIFEVTKDICQRYDVDGIELDFLRGPLLFARVAQGATDAGDDNRALLTEWMRRTRHMVEQVELKRGRPLVIAVRVPDDPDLAAAYGMDVRAWLNESLVDVLIAGSSSRIRPWREFVQFGHDAGVPVYACALEMGHEDDEVRGRALTAWGAGVDGIYMFNLFTPSSTLWNQIGDPKVLQQIDRMDDCRDVYVHHLMDHLPRLPGVRALIARPPRLPIDLPHDEARTLTFESGEDGLMIPGSLTPHATVRMRFELLENDDDVAVQLNGKAATLLRDQPHAGWITIADAASMLRCGGNALQLTVRHHHRRETHLSRLVAVRVHVTKQPQTFDGPSLPAGQSIAPSMPGLLGTSFLLTDSALLPPQRQFTAHQQWLMDEIAFARPRVPGVHKFINLHFHYDHDPIEQPLPGWHALAVLYDADELGHSCERDLLRTFFHQVSPSRLSDELHVHAGYFAGSHNLAGVVAVSRSWDDLETVAQTFGPQCSLPGLLPLPARFMRCENDGHRIAYAFALVRRGVTQGERFQSAAGLWSKNLPTDADVAGTSWHLVQPASKARSQSA